MAKLKLRPWKFRKDEKMRLHWICSPFKKNGKWTITAVFVPDSLKEDKTSLFRYGVEPIHQTIDLPWGILPNLRVGRVYTDGEVSEPSKNLFKGSLSLLDFQDGSICEATEMPKELYDFFDMSDFDKEKVWKFSVYGKTYFLPCLEIIRSFFATSKTFTNHLLKPDGLELLVADKNYDGETLSITLSHEIPRSIIKDDLVTHFLWVYYDDIARNCWESICNNLYSTAIQESPDDYLKVMSNGIPLEVVPPISGMCSIEFTCSTFKNYCLIHELLAIKGFPALEFDKIRYSHPSFRKTSRKNKNKSRKKGIPITRGSNFKQDSARRKVKTDINQPAVKIPETVFSFSKIPDIEKELISTEVNYSNQKTAKSGSTNTKTIVKNKDEDKVIGTDESYMGGKTSPVELLGLKLIESKDSSGLNPFLETLEHLKKIDSRILVSYKTYYVPGNYSFCFWKKNLRRSLIVTCVYKENIQPVYIFEISRLDGWSISTLLLQIHPKIEKQEKVNELLLLTVNEMIKNNGHWHMENLRQSSDMRCIQIKHYEDDIPENRADRIFQKLWILGFR